MDARRERAGGIRIGGRAVGPGHPCFVIAEAGVNHNGDVERALALVDAAADARADAVKFQTFRAEAVVSRFAPKAAYQRSATDPGESQLDMVRALELGADAHRRIAARCEARGVAFLSSPFDDASADLLVELGAPALKTGSGELTNLPFLAHLARKGLPLLVSTGMADLAEVERAVRTISENGSPPLALLHCVSAYPASPRDANIRAMRTLSERFRVPVGFSDHALGDAIALAACALGADLVEKHFTLDKRLPGPDQAMSLSPDELAAFVARVRDVEAALGDGVKRPMPGERDVRAVARRSLVALGPLAAGTALDAGMLAAKRPGTGVPPDRLADVVGRRLALPLAADEPLTWAHLGGDR